MDRIVVRFWIRCNPEKSAKSSDADATTKYWQIKVSLYVITLLQVYPEYYTGETLWISNAVNLYAGTEQ